MGGRFLGLKRFEDVNVLKLNLKRVQELFAPPKAVSDVSLNVKVSREQ